MQAFEQYAPTRILFGRGMEERVPQQIRNYGGSNVLLVYGGGSVKRSGLLAKIETKLSEAGLAFEELGGVQPNPLLSLAQRGAEKARAMGADFVLAVGGGSVIDTAKAIAIGAANPNVALWDFWLRKYEVKASLPVGVVLTISAAGSETSWSSVLTNDRLGEKRGLSSDANRPKFAVMNPELTFTLPQYQVACGIVDILMHTLDRYFTCTKGNGLTDAFAEALLRTTIENGKKAIRNSHDYDAMSELMWCGSNSHNGLTGLGAQMDFATHQLSHELSGRFDTAHGASLAAVWGSWAAYVYQTDVSRFARYAKEVWGIEEETEGASAVSAIKTTVDYFRTLGMPTCFTELGIGVQPDNVLRELTDSCLFHGKRTIGSFQVLNNRDVYQIYQMANH